MSLNNRQIKNSYKDLLVVNNNNSGVDGTSRKIEDGEGTESCASLSTNVLQVAPASNSSTTFLVANAAEDVLFQVNSTASSVTHGTTQSHLNSQYLRFMAKDIDVNNGTHYGVPIVGFYTSGSSEMPNTEITFGTSADPSASNPSGSDADDWIHYLHYVDTNITIDAVNILVGATAAGGDSLNFHLVKLATTDTTTINSWSSTTIVADDSGTTNAGYEQFYRVALDIQSANVDAGDYLALTVEGNGTNSDYTINALVRYHFR